MKYVILGIGVDVNLGAADFPPNPQAGDLAQNRGGRAVSRSELATAILRELDRDYGRGSAISRWSRTSGRSIARPGRQVAIQIGDRKIRGRAESLGEDGALLLRTEHGHLERIIGGDVTLEK